LPLPEAIASTAELASRLQFTLKDLGYKFPTYPTSTTNRRWNTCASARWKAWSIATARKNDARTCKSGTFGHQLDLPPAISTIVWDIIPSAARKIFWVQGRGSAANSAVCYSLGITAVDPVGMNLLFERFLSEERGEWPDIDLDLPSGDQRERVIQYVYERYGKLGAAMTANVITYRGKSAAREIGESAFLRSETLDR
jgi:error-prone DNA polymerase